MTNKNNKGTALGLVLIMLFVFLIVGTAALRLSSANVQQGMVAHAVNTHFWEAESYLHERIQDIYGSMQNDISSGFQTRVNALLPTPLNVDNVPAPHENVGSYLAHRINQGIGGTGSNFRTHLEEDINTAFLTARDNPDLRSGSLEDGNIYGDLEISSIELNLPVNPAAYIDTGSSSGSVRVPFNPGFTLTAQSAGVITSVDVILDLWLEFDFEPRAGNGSIIPSLPDETFVPYPPSDTSPEDCERDCYHSFGREYTCIHTPEQLQNIRNAGVSIDGRVSNGIYILANDINLTEDFTPIPNFTGTLNGNGRTISNMNIGGSGSNRGMFESLGRGAVIENLIINGLTINNTGNNKGALAGHINIPGGSSGVGVTINNVRLHDINIYGPDRTHVGGLAGLMNLGGTSTINYVHVSGTVTGSNQVGGLIGRTESGGRGAAPAGFADLSNVAFTGTVSGGYHVGGLIGRILYGNVNVSQGYVDGTVYGHNRVGGAFGAVNNTGGGARRASVIEYVVSHASVISRAATPAIAWAGPDYFGGLVGHAGYPDGGGPAIIRRSAVYGTVNARVGANITRVGGFAGTAQRGVIIEDSYAINDVIGQTVVGGFLGNTFAGSAIIRRTYSAGRVNANSAPLGAFTGRHEVNTTYQGGNFFCTSSLGGQAVANQTHLTATQAVGAYAANHTGTLPQGLETPNPNLAGANTQPLSMFNPDSFPEWNINDPSSPWRLPTSPPFRRPYIHGLWSPPADNVGGYTINPPISDANFSRLENLREITG